MQVQPGTSRSPQHHQGFCLQASCIAMKTRSPLQMAGKEGWRRGISHLELLKLPEGQKCHFAFLIKPGLEGPSLFNVYVALAKHHVSGLEATSPVQAHLNTKVLRCHLFYIHVRSPQTMANLRFISGDKFWGQTSSAFSYKTPKPSVLCYAAIQGTLKVARMCH